jgi:hypothetical protein
MPVTDVVRVVQQLFVVGTHVQRDRNHPSRIDPGGRGVYGELAHGDLYSTDTPVTDTQDLLSVSGNDQIHVIGAQPHSGQRRFHPVGFVDRQEDATRTTVFMAVTLDRLAHRRVVDDRHHLPQMIRQQPVEQHLVVVLQHHQENVLEQVARLLVILLVHPGDLILQGQHRRWQQPLQPQRLPFLAGERRPLVQQGNVQHLHPARCGLVTVTVDPEQSFRRHLRRCGHGLVSFE